MISQSANRRGGLQDPFFNDKTVRFDLFLESQRHTKSEQTETTCFTTTKEIMMNRV